MEGAGSLAVSLRVPAPSPRRAGRSRGGAGPERECGPQEGPEQRPARGPLPSTEASMVIMLSLCPGGRLRTGVHAGVPFSVRFWVCPDQTVTGDLYQLSTFYDFGNAIPFGRMKRMLSVVVAVGARVSHVS